MCHRPAGPGAERGARSAARGPLIHRHAVVVGSATHRYRLRLRSRLGARGQAAAVAASTTYATVVHQIAHGGCGVVVVRAEQAVVSSVAARVGVPVTLHADSMCGVDGVVSHLRRIALTPIDRHSPVARQNTTPNQVSASSTNARSTPVTRKNPRAAAAARSLGRRTHSPQTK